MLTVLVVFAKTKEQNKDSNPETAWYYFQLKIQTQSEDLSAGRLKGRIGEWGKCLSVSEN